MLGAIKGGRRSALHAIRQEKGRTDGPKGVVLDVELLLRERKAGSQAPAVP